MEEGGDGWNFRECRDHAGREKGGAGSKRGWPREPKGDGAQKRPGTQEFGQLVYRLHPGLGVEVAGLAVFCQRGVSPHVLLG